jgi:crotonobetainyl-CoA:carnitine CoA-transferase CaiB-like acyl-CoA transferase
VLEVGERLGCASAGLALAALGAEVAQLRLQTRRVPGAEAAYYDRGRVTVPFDPGQDVRDLSDMADVILSDLEPPAMRAWGLPASREELAAVARERVLVSIRPLGLDGPCSGFRMTDLTEWAAGGLAPVTRRPLADDSDRFVPVVPPGFQPQALAGLAAATATFAALRWSRRTGEPVVVDVSVQEVVAATLHSVFPPFVWNNNVLGHPAAPGNSYGMLLPASDGDVYIRTVEVHQWDKLMAWLGEPDWRSLGDDPDSRLANLPAICALVGQWTCTRGREELLVEGQRRKVPIALPRSLGDVLRWQHLRARGTWTSVDLDGTSVEVARIPLLEPAGWAPNREETARQVAERWSKR